MKLFFDPRQLGHRPTQYMVHGRVVAPLENPERAATLAASLADLGLKPIAPGDAGLGPIHAVHSADYVAFLAEAYERFQALANAGPEVWPNVHPYRGADAALSPRGAPKPTGIIGRAGWYLGDLSCAMMAGTYAAAYASAQTAVAGADAIRAGDRAAFALCRPPGHHAYADRASGFCFLNNAAIAAMRLREQFARVAIVDFDTHHGDGTQAIFFTRGDIFYGSVHTDPSAYYPHFAGYADERGVGEGEGANLNLQLPFGAEDAAFLEANRRLAAAVTAFGADALVISAGWDAHRDDPLSRLAVTSAAFSPLGALWGGLRLPTLIVQEGGYSLAAIAEAAPAFIAAFADAV